MSQMVKVNTYMVGAAKKTLANSQAGANALNQTRINKLSRVPMISWKEPRVNMFLPPIPGLNRMWVVGMTWAWTRTRPFHLLCSAPNAKTPTNRWGPRELPPLSPESIPFWIPHSSRSWYPRKFQTPSCSSQPSLWKMLRSRVKIRRSASSRCQWTTTMARNEDRAPTREREKINFTRIPLFEKPGPSYWPGRSKIGPARTAPRAVAPWDSTSTIVANFGCCPACLPLLARPFP